MKSVSIMAKIVSWLTGIVLLVLVCYLYLSPDPHFGSTIPLSHETPMKGNAKLFGSEDSLLTKSACEAIMHSVKSAKGGGPVHACPPFGSIAIEYSNGDTNTFTIMRGHRMGRVDLIFQGRCYSMSSQRLFGTLAQVGIKMETD